MAHSGSPTAEAPISYDAQRASPYGTTSPDVIWTTGHTGTDMTLQSGRVYSSTGRRENSMAEQAAPYVCEFLGTFMLAFTAACCYYTETANKAWYFTAIGCAYVVIMYAVGCVSGGHLNPAITLVAFLVGKLPCSKLIGYCALQLLAGLVAGFFFELVFWAPTPGAKVMHSFDFGQAALVEFLFTTMLCFVAVHVLCSTRNAADTGHFFALAIGFAVLAGGYAIGDISGAWLNPALSVGLNLAGWWRGSGVLNGALYGIMELLGACCAALLFRLSQGLEQEHWHHLAFERAYFVQDGLGSPTLFARLLSEFVGTFFVVLTFCLNVVMSSVATAWSVTGALLCMVYALGNLSGAHLNPAVTTAMVLTGRDRCTVKDGMCYIMAQLLASITAGMVTIYVHSHAPAASVHFGLYGLNGRYPWGAAMTLELLFTFLLTYVVLTVSTCDTQTPSSLPSRQNCYFGLAIGFTVAACIVAAGPVSGGYMNPAVALGFAVEDMPSFEAPKMTKDSTAFPVIQRGISVIHQFVSYMAGFFCYSIFELVGAVMAAAMFRLTHPGEYSKKLPLMQHAPVTTIVK